MSDILEIKYDTEEGVGNIKQTAPLNVGLMSKDNLYGLKEILKDFLPIKNDWERNNDEITNNNNKQLERTTELLTEFKKFSNRNKEKDDASKILGDAIGQQQKSGQVFYRVATGVSKLVSSSASKILDQMKTEKEMINSLAKANVHIESGSKSFMQSMVDMANKVGVSVEDMTRSIAKNSGMISRLNALGFNGPEAYADAMSGWKDVYNMTASESETVMTAVEGLTLTMNRSQLENINLEQVFNKVATNGKILSEALGISTEELIKINKRQEQNLALEGFKLQSSDNRNILNLLGSMGMDDEIKSFIVAGKYSSKVANIMAMNPEYGQLLRDMRQSILRGDNLIDFVRNNANQQNRARETTLELNKRFAGSLPGSYMGQNSAFMQAFTMNYDVIFNKDKIDELLQQAKDVNNGISTISQDNLFKSTKDYDIAKTQLSNMIDLMKTPTDDFVIYMNRAGEAASKFAQRFFGMIDETNASQLEKMRNLASFGVAGGVGLQALTTLSNFVPGLTSILSNGGGKVGLLGKMGRVGAMGGGMYTMYDLVENHNERAAWKNILEGTVSGGLMGGIGGPWGALAGAAIGGIGTTYSLYKDDIAKWWNNDKSPVENNTGHTPLNNSNVKSSDNNEYVNELYVGDTSVNDILQSNNNLQKDTNNSLKTLIGLTEDLTRYMKTKQA